ncbi:hypothetical protein BGW38_009884 [Lunasporangiospora selenospora]|uniref:Uncharacterized protein n=1 Tax=Lunasporangiospora selenospora TaxID=979761 RepID=A0A9P6FWR3_9FUNG|nr:hypothetical protein BGW38_009884 [Lunasporangiospora selenospora]
MTLYHSGFGTPSNRLLPAASSALSSARRVLYAGWACFIVEDKQGKALICGKHSQQEQDLVTSFNLTLAKSAGNDRAVQDDCPATRLKFFGWSALQGFLDPSGNVIGLGYGHEEPLFVGAKDVASCGAPMGQMVVVIDDKTRRLFSWTPFDPTFCPVSPALSSLHPQPSISAVKPSCSLGSTSAIAPSLLSQEPRFVQVWAGESHFLALAEDGTLYSWGSARFGQLGHGELHSEPVPKPIESLQGIRIVGAACGAAFSIALSGKLLSTSCQVTFSASLQSGDIYTFGLDDHGQLGIGDMSEQRRTTAQPQLVDFLDAATGEMIEVNVAQVSCGSAHLVVVDDKGEVWSCGWGKYGQLGLEAALVKDKTLVGMEDRMLRTQGTTVIMDDQHQMQKVFVTTNTKPWIGLVCGLWSTFLWTE